MSKHNKNRPHETGDKFRAKGEQMLDDVDQAAGRLKEDIHEDVEKLEERGRSAVTDMKTKARNVGDKGRR